MKKYTPLQKGFNEYAYPGLRVGVIEEFTPSEGIYEVDGNLIASYFGLIERDLNKRTIRVVSLRKTRWVNVGDEVVGWIRELTGVYGIVKIEFVNQELVKPILTSILYPTKRLRENEKQYSIGDMVYAVIESLKNRAIHLSMRNKKYGVILTLCSNCGVQMEPLEGRLNMLICPKCRNKEERKVSELYCRLDEILGVKW